MARLTQQGENKHIDVYYDISMHLIAWYMAHSSAAVHLWQSNRMITCTKYDETFGVKESTT